ncbi:MAG TPA: GHMP kinase [Methylomusa anaerophila]|uniref:L-threonine kinase n=1 Tax=Methylomusa anaerophila TaxID=1930071 RepID=A0A348AQD4_9FIRM|nr:GHMP kinase [Methylomusa anaerophila]BBB93282.1 L-threonine kinase [Methylomusa anaerophila]HML86887.1 GHMP kinase [Methylomusa anaerophila]
MNIKVRAPGSCGELVQGTLGGVNFLITCPINWYSEAEASIGGTDTPVSKPKVVKAVNQTLQYLGSSLSIGINITSDLPEGKGMASSSADISAACQATAIAVTGRMLTCDEVADIALDIEPTDGIFFPGITMIDHIKGTIRRVLGQPPPIYIAVFDAGGEVDTLAFNNRQDLARLNQEKAARVSQAADLVIRGIRTGDASLVGKGATISALANQSILYKPCLETLIHLAESFGAVGVCAAHSGTVIGVLFDAGKMKRHTECVNAICSICKEVTYLKTVELIAGGLEIIGVTEISGREKRYGYA